jgi:CheY-like chemotaxis protein
MMIAISQSSWRPSSPTRAEVSCLYEVRDDSLRRVVAQIEADCVLLDGVPGSEYGSWESAAWMDHRGRAIPVVMFTAHRMAVAEAEEGISERAKQAGFAAVVGKPFSLDELLEAVATAVGKSQPFDRGPQAEAARTRALVDALHAAGALEIAPSERRECATFRNADGVLHQVYWWQGRGVYQLGRYGQDGTMSMVGQFTDLHAAIGMALKHERSN